MSVREAVVTWLSEWMKIYRWRLTISTQSDICSQRQVPPQAESTITWGQYGPRKLTPKTQTGNIGIHNVTHILHNRFGENRTYIITNFQVHTQTRARKHTHTHTHTHHHHHHHHHHHQRKKHWHHQDQDWEGFQLQLKRLFFREALKEWMESLSLMPPGNAFQRDGATYLKARWPYHFVLESLGLGTSRRDLEADLRGREGV